MLKFEVVILGELGNNSYIVWDEKSMEGLVIDPSDNEGEIAERIERLKIKLKMVVLTHGHFDHVMGALELKLIYKAPIWGSVKDEFLLARQKETASYFLKREIEIPNLIKIDGNLDQVEEVTLGNEKLKIIRTPGHTPGGICLYYEKQGWLFSGDTLFADGLRGRTDFSYSSKDSIFKSLYRLMQLPEETRVLPGHDAETTIGKERGRYRFREENKT